MHGEGAMCGEGVCVVKWGMCSEGDMHDEGGCAWLRGACMVKGPCVVKGGMHGEGGGGGGGGHAWQVGECAGQTATEAGGTHPTGMHSCFF